MAEIKLVRADFRLIHGQVVVRWTKQTQADRIIVINDMLSKDEFMSSIYIMAAPPGVKVSIYSIEEAVAKWKENEMGDGKLLILFKNVEDAYKAYLAGLPIKEFQIGGLGGAPGRVNVFGPITLDAKDAEILSKMQESGCRVYFHVVPDEDKRELSDILAKHKF